MHEIDDAIRAPLWGLDLEEQNLPHLLERQAEWYGDRPLVRAQGGARSYRGMRDAAARTAAHLAARGVGPGDRVALCCSNRIEFLDVFFGCAWMGAIAVPLNTAWRGSQLTHALENSQPSVIVLEQDFEELIRSSLPPDLVPNLWVIDDAGTVMRPSDPTDPMPLRSAVDPGEPAAILYTSGTTGPSKGVTCPHAQFYWWGVTFGDTLGLRDDDLLYNCLPLFHVNALTTPIQALLSGGSCAIGTRFSASEFWHEVAACAATVTYLLGGMSNLLLAQPPSPADREHGLRAILAPGTPADIYDQLQRRFSIPELAESYGMSELNLVIGQARGHRTSRAGYSGHLLVDAFEARVVDEFEREVHPGQPGELLVRGRHPHCISLGYWGMPEETVAATRNLWFHTGDLVVREVDGAFRFVGRRKDSIRRLGENVSAWEVEQAVLAYDGVADVAVFPVTSELQDEEVMAAIVSRDGEDLDPGSIVEFLQTRLARFAIPRFIEIVDGLPRTESGKVSKGPLRDRGVTSATWDGRIDRVGRAKFVAPEKAGGV